MKKMHIFITLNNEENLHYIAYNFKIEEDNIKIHDVKLDFPVYIKTSEVNHMELIWEK